MKAYAMLQGSGTSDIRHGTAVQNLILPLSAPAPWDRDAERARAAGLSGHETITVHREHGWEVTVPAGMT